MAQEKLIFPVDAIQNTNEESVYFGKVYATSRLVSTLSTEGLADHIAHHGSLVTKEVIMLVLNQLQKCIPELLAQGYAVKLEGLGTFQPNINGAKPHNSVKELLAKGLDDERVIGGVAINFIPVREKLFSLASKAMKAMCVFQYRDYIINDWYMKPDPHHGSPKKVIVQRRIALDKVKEYVANGGIIHPRELTPPTP